MPPLPTEFQVTESAEEYTISASSQRKLMAESLPSALEYALLSTVVSRAWAKTGLEPYDPNLVLKDLTVGPVLKRSTNYPAISETILTSISSVISVWKWKSERIAKEIRKTDDESLKKKLRDEMLTLDHEVPAFESTLYTEGGESDTKSRSEGGSKGESQLDSEQIVGLERGPGSASSSEASSAGATNPQAARASSTNPQVFSPSSISTQVLLPTIPPHPPSSIPASTITETSSKIVPTPQPLEWMTPHRLFPLPTLISPSTDLFFTSPLTKKSSELSEQPLIPLHKERIRMDREASAFSLENINSTKVTRTEAKNTTQMKSETVQTELEVTLYRE